MTNVSGLAVEVRNLSVRFGDFTVVDDISFSVKKGEIFGFLGANGAGKTTTIRVLCGLLIPSSGEAEIAGIGFDQGRGAIKEKVGYMSQKFTLYNDLTVQENLVFTASLRKIEKTIYQKREQELFEFIHFTYSPDTLVRDLPGGIKQQVSLVAAMLHDPEIIFLDEPTAGVSPESRERFWALIRKLSGAGKTVFVTTHYMDEAEQCERIALMRSGRIIALDSPQKLKTATFPEPIFELEPKPHSSLDWVDEMQKRRRDFQIKPYGMRYHLIVKNPPAWDEFYAKIEQTVKRRIIQPSLEDVFIRLVEGDAS